MSPKAVLTDDSAREDSFFLNAIEDKAGNLGVTTLQIPSNAGENINWITKLDSDSLKGTSLKPQVDVHN